MNETRQRNRRTRVRRRGHKMKADRRKGIREVIHVRKMLDIRTFHIEMDMM